MSIPYPDDSGVLPVSREREPESETPAAAKRMFHCIHPHGSYPHQMVLAETPREAAHSFARSYAIMHDVTISVDGLNVHVSAPKRGWL